MARDDRMLVLTGGNKEDADLPGRLRFFLGGHDLEMLTIGELIRRHSTHALEDRGLAWGAAASDYREAIMAALGRGETPVLVELRLDLDLPHGRVVVVDHHGEAAGRDRPTSLHQVFALLGLPSSLWTRRHELVAANDRGYIPELAAVGASLEEMREIRAADRAAQGVTAEQEAAAAAAAAHPTLLLGGRLAVFELPHAKTSPLVDRLQPELGGPGYENLLIRSPGEWNFFGLGSAVLALDRAFPGGWFGGGLPERGFWGIGGNTPARGEMLRVLQGALGGVVGNPPRPRRAGAALAHRGRG
jgi:hypothetical protein